MLADPIDLEKLLKIVNEEATRVTGTNACCIVATRVITSILPDFEPLEVEVCATNPLALAISQLDLPGRSQGVRVQHMVAYRPDDLVLDATIQQASRPKYGIIISEPVGIHRAGVKEAIGTGLMVNIKRGQLIYYLSENPNFLNDAWANAAAFVKPIERIVRKRLKI